MAAGLGFKTFTTGEVLTADNVNGYLMQGVLVFASAAARDAAITSPQEGQCCYLKDTDAVLTYSGSAWVGFDDSNAIQNSIVDAKGDIVAASGSDTPARLAVGNSGETLVADSAATTGLNYKPLDAAGKNAIINGGMDIWQRGTSAAGSYPTYLADRWMNYRAVAGSTFSRQVTGDTTNLPSIQYCQRLQRNSGNTATNDILISQSLESVNSIPLAGKTVIMSFYARAGSNLSSSGSIMFAGIFSGTGTDQNFIAGYTGNATVINQSKTLTTTWQRFTVTGTVGATATEIGVQLGFTPTGTASTNDYIEITGVQLELGSTATTFSRAGGTIQGELAACQRYFEKSYSPDTSLGTVDETYATWTSANAGDTTLVNGTAYFKVTKRTQPTITIYNTSSGATGSFLATSTSYTVSSVSTGTLGIGRVYATTGMTANTYVRFHWTASAEL